ncbi:hypothetical protein JKP88DRAFT_350318 [Tribonema minus]|uniref:GOLD domain-containing protein n=1 Tax=Tribonema minus TaxID=303371 RepID=A0A835YPW5_9STRA|nr:hypothetical protein JKP88DRAFT_350318 [Tribonema minus]
MRLALWLTLVSGLACKALCMEPLTVVLEPDEKACFYEIVTPEDEGDRTVEVFVLRGNRLSVGLTVRGPFKQQQAGHPATSMKAALETSEVVAEQDEMEHDPSMFGQTHKQGFNAAAGVYEICLDNSGPGVLGSPGRKLVQLQVRADARITADAAAAARERESARLAASAAAAKGAPAATDDLGALATQLLRLRAELDAVDAKQARERRRLAVHSASEQRASAGMMLGSALETLVFIGAGVFQVAFIARWFRGRAGGGAGSARGTHQWA